jgi:hypothetical protein
VEVTDGNRLYRFLGPKARRYGGLGCFVPGTRRLDNVPFLVPGLPVTQGSHEGDDRYSLVLVGGQHRGPGRLAKTDAQ